MPNRFSAFKESAGRYLTSIFILGTALALTVGMAFLRQPPEEKEQSGLVQTVAVAPATDFDGKLDIRVSGMVQPHREVEMAAQVAGEIQEKYPECRAGRFVEAGTVLLEIDSTNYNLVLERLKAEKEQAEASASELEQEISNLDSSIDLLTKEFNLKLEDWKRKENLSALSESERNQAEQAFLQADRSLQELKNTRDLTKTREIRLKAAIKLAAARLKEAEKDIERCKIVAPFSGVIVQDSVEKGDYVNNGQTVVVLEDTSRADVTCNLRLEQLQKIIQYQTSDSRRSFDPTTAYELPATDVTITRERTDGSLVKWHGTLDRYDGIGVDAQTKMIPCRIVVEDPISVEEGQAKALVRGMFVSAKIELNVYPQEGTNLLTFPTIAVRPGNFVWAVKDGKLTKHDVEILNRKGTENPNPQERMVVVRVDENELKAGDNIVITALTQPTEGLTVTILNEDDPPGKANGESVQDAPEQDQSDKLKAVPGDSTSTSGDATTEPASARKEEGAVRS